ncbi:MAG: [citrate (pro-3S)-lyase] ligase [Synergistaceae bacterium]|nr:[citrate (pro-3S)-lyase] ligase [Synergistaceae bacterium]
MFDFESRIVNVLSAAELAEVARLIESQGLVYEEGADVTALVEDVGGHVVATAGLFGNVIRAVAVSSEHQESGLSAVALSNVMEAARVRGLSHLFVYTKSDMAARFAALGFRNIAETPNVTLLEMGEPSIVQYRKSLAENRASVSSGMSIASVVVNCNPFTRGHRHLMNLAARENDFLFVVVVEAELSFFTVRDRLEMVRRGVSDIVNARVIGSGEYAVSAATFPTYFLKDRGKESVATEQAGLDIDLFLRLYVPTLGITARYVGTETESPVTRIYNETMRKILPPAGVRVIEIDRLRTDSGDVISASKVRAMLSSGKTDGIGDYVPDSTADWLIGMGHRL